MAFIVIKCERKTSNRCPIMLPPKFSFLSPDMRPVSRCFSYPAAGPFRSDGELPVEDMESQTRRFSLCRTGRKKEIRYYISLIILDHVLSDHDTVTTLAYRIRCDETDCSATTQEDKHIQRLNTDKTKGNGGAAAARGTHLWGVREVAESHCCAALRCSDVSIGRHSEGIYLQPLIVA